MKKLRLLLLGLIVMGTLLSSFHHHADGLSHSDCQVCTVQQNLDSANDVDSFVLADVDSKIDTLIAFNESFYGAELSLHTHARAPPSFS